MEPDRTRPPRRPRRPDRDPVGAGWVPPDDLDDWFPGDDPGDDHLGGSGVREPRNPRPPGPMSGAGQKPMPEPELHAVLPDPRYLLDTPA